MTITVVRAMTAAVGGDVQFRLKQYRLILVLSQLLLPDFQSLIVLKYARTIGIRHVSNADDYFPLGSSDYRHIN